ncbi:MAG TPA: hypothetical protein VFP70_09720 [Burkholderiales bacterium]|nr:hypothetical protein [Burkholderiales bacterium]
MHASHDPQAKPSLLVLICLAVVHRSHPHWLAIRLGDAAAQGGVAPQRLSRLCSRALPRMSALCAALTRRGRPPGGAEVDHAQADAAITAALLEVATSLLEAIRPTGPVVRALVVGAVMRLRIDQPTLTRQRLCGALALSPRTLRAWLAQAHKTKPPQAPPLPPPRPPRDKRQRLPRRRRFDFDVVLPGTQFAADTTDLGAFGVPLKLIATQDVGGRDASLLEAVLVDSTESAERVCQVLTETLAQVPGAQLLTDQGTPYLAQLTRATLDTLEVEHAIQREADPCGKSTIERAFGSVKTIAQPLLSLSDRLAAAVPPLARADLAQAATTLLITALLRAYQAGARAAHRASTQRTGSANSLAQAAHDHRAQARADDKSARLLLTHVHQIGAIHEVSVGPASAWLRGALAALAQAAGPAAHDLATGAFHDFAASCLDRLGPDGIAAVHQVFLCHLHQLPAPPAPASPTSSPAAICYPAASRQTAPAAFTRPLLTLSATLAGSTQV